LFQSSNEAGNARLEGEMQILVADEVGAEGRQTRRRKKGRGIGEKE